LWKFQTNVFKACEIFSVKKFSFFVDTSSEHFLSKNKLCFDLYQHNFHQQISGQQRQKEGNSEQEKLREKWTLKLKLKKVFYFKAAENHFIQITMISLFYNF